MRTELPCLPLIQERFWNKIKDKNEYKEIKCYPNFTLRMFPQVWGDTSLGFGGLGGQAMTMAYTTIIEDEDTGWCGVFFGERLAYIILCPNKLFYADIYSGYMASVSMYGKYIKKD